MKNSYAKIISFILILASVYWSFTTQMPSKISDLNTPKTKFSTERALVHLEKITKKPHYVGTEEHTKVRNYLVHELEKLGLKVEIQEQMAINKKWRGAVKAKNIIAKIKGSESGKSLVLLSHYDSAVHSSYGASDAGSGVVTILEGVRAFLETGKKPKNDIIILITDAEEVGLLGAVAFVKHHPWAKEVGLILNFEARGSGGPSYMLLETNGGNKNLIKAFNQANPNYPVANSLMYSIYKMLPNDTDLTPLREDGNLNGINFAFIDDHFDYHTALDTYENLDRNTLEQQGDYLMTMLAYFSDFNLENLNSKTDNVYFSFPKMGLITYPFSWIRIMFILAFLLFLGITYYGVQKNRLSTQGMFAGLVPFLVSMMVSVLVAVFGWKLVQIIHPQYQDILHGFTYNGHWYILAFVSITLAISFFFYKRYFTKHSAANLLVAPIFIWLLINLLIVFSIVKGAAFFILPVYGALATLAMLLYSKRGKAFKIIVSTLLAIPTIFVFAPLVQMFPVGLGLKMLGVSALFVVLLFGLFLPIFKKWKNTKNLSYLFLAIGFLALIIASFKSSYNTIRKQPNSLNYVLDVDNKKAFLASYEKELTPYTNRYLGDNPKKGSFEKTAGDSKYGTKYNLYAKTKIVSLAVPNIEVIKDTVILNERFIELQIIPQRKTNRTELIAKNTIHFNSFSVNGEELKANAYDFNTENRKNILTYYFTEENEVLNFKFSIPKKEKPEIILYDIAYDIFTNKKISIVPRKDTTFPTPFVINDATIIKTEIKL